MMLPSATPMVRMFARSAEEQSEHAVGSLINAFVAGYLAVWTAFSAVITFAQWGLLELRHGAYCAGCCAMLMLLLFVLGVMNLLWIAVLTLIVLTEKLLPSERLWPSRLLGAGLIVWGGYVLPVARG